MDIFIRPLGLSGEHVAYRAARACFYVCFSNRPVWVKRFQTIHQYSVDVARGLVLLFGIGTRALVWGFFSQGV